MAYIVVSRRSPNARYLDVELDSTVTDKQVIAVHTDEPTLTYITDEPELVSYVNGADTDPRAIEVRLAERVLGWDIPG